MHRDEDRQPLQLKELPEYRPYNPGQLECNANLNVAAVPTAPITPNIPLSTNMTIHHHADISRTQLGACWFILSILNFICCPQFGIPALIFAILGQEAEKRREVEIAKSHGFHAKIFNIIALVMFIIPVVIVIMTILIPTAIIIPAIPR